MFSRTFPSGPVVFYVCEDELSSLSFLYRSGAILPQKQLSDPLILLFRLQRQRLVFSRLLFVFFFIFTSAFDPQLPLLNTASPIFLRLPAVARHLSCHPSPLSSVSTSLPVPTPLSPFIAHFLSKRRYRRSSLTSCPNASVAVHRLLPVPTSFSVAVHRSLPVPTSLSGAIHRSLPVPTPPSVAVHRSLPVPTPLSVAVHRSLPVPTSLSVAVHRSLPVLASLSVAVHSSLPVQTPLSPFIVHCLFRHRLVSSFTAHFLSQRRLVSTFVTHFLFQRRLVSPAVGSCGYRN